MDLQTANAALEAGRYEEARIGFEELLGSAPDDPGLLNGHARTLDAIGHTEGALRSIERCLEINPLNTADWRNRGIALKKLGRTEEAIASFDRALELEPNHTDTWVRRAELLRLLERREEALASVERGLAADPNSLNALNARGMALEALGRYDEAMADFKRIRTLDPDNVDALNNCGLIHARQGNFTTALACYEQSLALRPDEPSTRYNQSLIHLALGRWDSGFAAYETRWLVPPFNKMQWPKQGKRWDGKEDLTHKILLVIHEQGFGDTLQASRYVSRLIQQGISVCLLVPNSLKSLMKGLPGHPEIFSESDTLPSFDRYIPIMSLPGICGTTPESIPLSGPYLGADPAAAGRWDARLPVVNRPRIGLVWSGRIYPPVVYKRDLALSLIQPLLELDAEWISLQHDIPALDQDLLKTLPKVHRLGETVKDFADTAALIETLDLVISADTAVAHLAGAMGKPVWLLNRYASCWRWLQSGETTGWYPSMRIFRQPQLSDWASVIARVKDATRQWIRQWSVDARAFSPERALPDQTRLDGAVHLPADSPSRQKGRGPMQKIRLVSATRLSTEEFFSKAALGRSLPWYRTFPVNQRIELRLFTQNSQSLPSVYNTAIEEARSDPAILVFIHDDVFLSDFYWAHHLNEALNRFDIVGLAGNRRRVPGQPSWMYIDIEFTRDRNENLSGVIGHGESFPNLKQLSYYGEPGQPVVLLDGVLIAVRSQTLIERELRFDPRFEFDFYDLDFCRQAELRGLRMGTWPISVVHASAGQLGTKNWRSMYQKYREKYGE